MTDRQPFPPDYEVVTRRVNRRTSSLPRALDGLPLRVGSLCFDRPFVCRGDDAALVWRTTGLLYGRGLRVAQYTVVVVEIDAWSQHASELRLRPMTRRLPTWGKRRQRRYFRAAHDTADEFVRLLDARSRLARGFGPQHRVEQPGEARVEIVATERVVAAGAVDPAFDQAGFA